MRRSMSAASTTVSSGSRLRSAETIASTVLARISAVGVRPNACRPYGMFVPCSSSR